MAKEKSNRVTLANVLTLLGLAGVGVISFYGMLLHTEDGKPGGPILGAVALTAGLGLLVFMAVKAKTAKDNIGKWRIVEYVLLVAYLATAVLCARPFLRFFFITSQMDNMKKQGLEEVATLEKIYSNYESQSKRYLKNAVEDFKNYMESDQYRSGRIDDLKKYVEDKQLTSGLGLSDWQGKAELVVRLDSSYYSKLNSVKNQLNNMKFMNLVELANTLETLDKTTLPNLQEKIKKYGVENHLIPEIEGGGNNYRLKNDYAEFDLGESPTPSFANMLRTSDGSTVLGWVLLAILHILVLMSYIFARRTNIVKPTRRLKIADGRTL